MVESDEGHVTLEFKTTHALLVAFVVGVFAGGFFMSALDTLAGPTGAVVQDTQNTQDAPSPVRLQSTSFKFSSVNMGVASGELQWPNGTVSVEGEPYLGSPDAPVKIVSYEDFQCPFCKRYNENAFPKIVRNYVATGKVQYVYKHLPLTQLHPWAKPAAVAAECAENQDPQAFWMFKQGFFNNQEQLSSIYQSDTAVFDKTMRIWADQLGLDVQKFRSCYDNQKTLDEVNADSAEARTLGASGTPTIFINGKKIVGAQPYSRFKSVIESELSG